MTPENSEPVNTFLATKMTLFVYVFAKENANENNI